MSLKVPLAAVLRALRAAKRLPQEALPDEGSARQYIGDLEHGKSSLTLDKLEKLSESLGLSPATVVAATMVVKDGGSIETILARLSEELNAIQASGQLEQALSQVVDGKLVDRPRGTSINADLLAKVLDCKAKGMTQAETASELQVNKVTVHRYWKLG
ncbi:XRE family transcriptional regulator [Pseudomonas sp. v388]|uniref:helix-turn-helix domain-containing protein n=1 Tax=Pseudomonas sp. v388 TaxID=2479849 RepID=UPI000F78763E|nr:helix-turn-helix transcriptional regulator [Pseudomonas sp. v388]RRV10589.1 XRE family transcriptional regulator [Pseudomonas sp. v388]